VCNYAMPSRWVGRGLPPADLVVRYGGITAGILGVTIASLAWECLQDEELSADEKSRRQEETKRRAERLQELLRAVSNTEDEEASGTRLGQVRHEMVLVRCRELEQLAQRLDADSPERALLKKGFHWCTVLLRKELRVAIILTSEGKNVHFSDGSRLAFLLKQPETLYRVSQRAKCPVPPELRAELDRKVRNGEAVQRKRALVGLRKAFYLLFRVKATWPWVAGNNVIAVVSGVLSTFALEYQYVLLESFLVPRSGRQRFKQMATAWMTVELVTTLLSIVEHQLSARGEKAASKRLQVQLFRAVARQELAWYERKADSDMGEIEALVFKKMPGEVSKMLNVPRDFLRRTSSMLTAAWRVRTRSHGLLYFMVSVNFGKRLVSKGLQWFREHVQRRVYAGMLMPSTDDQTYRYALRPEYTTLYQSFVRGPQEARRYEQTLANHQRFESRMGTVGQIVTPAEKVMSQSLAVLQYSAVGDLIEGKIVTEGEARGLMHHAGEITRHLQGSYDDWISAQDNCVDLAKAYDLITMAPKIDPDSGEVPSGGARGHIIYEDAWFNYPERHAEVLRGASLEVQPGQVAALVGKTGCGKSTTFRLLQRFYDVTQGCIKLDGKDIREYSPEWLRAQIASVSQEPELIPLTIRDNIAMGCHHDPSAEEIEEACKAANIWTALGDKSKFPEGLQTRMRAVKNISGGEKQRICIARAILANPPVLLLDEATSALDKQTEKLVQEALDNLMRNRTTLVIAHRLSTIRNADKIFGMKDGKVVEEGTHDELVQKSGDDPTSVYGRLWREQMMGERKSSASAITAAELADGCQSPADSSTLEPARSLTNAVPSSPEHSASPRVAVTSPCDVVRPLNDPVKSPEHTVSPSTETAHESLESAESPTDVVKSAMDAESSSAEATTSLLEPSTDAVTRPAVSVSSPTDTTTLSLEPAGSPPNVVTSAVNVASTPMDIATSTPEPAECPVVEAGTESVGESVDPDRGTHTSSTTCIAAGVNVLSRSSADADNVSIAPNANGPNSNLAADRDLSLDNSEGPRSKARDGEAKPVRGPFCSRRCPARRTKPAQ